MAAISTRILTRINTDAVGERPREPKHDTRAETKALSGRKKSAQGWSGAITLGKRPQKINSFSHRMGEGGRRLDEGNPLCALRSLAAIKSVNQNEHRRILRRLHHVLKLPVSRHRRFEFGVNVRHRLQEAQQKTALDRVIHILRQRPARRQPREIIQRKALQQPGKPISRGQRRPRMVAVRKHLGRHDADDVAPLIHQRTMLVLPFARLHGGRLQRPR